MKRFSVALFGGLIFSVVCVSGSSADPEACGDAANHFTSAKSDIESAASDYESCVSGSNGHEDCSSEFSTLDSDHNDFESAVSEYEEECS